MTVTTYSPYIDTGDGVTTVRTVTWNPISLEFLLVEKEEISTGTRTTLVSPADYTATLLTNGFSFTITPALTSDFRVIVSLNVPLTQGQPYRTSVSWDGRVIENSFDKLTAITQQIGDTSGRSLQLPIGSSVSAVIPAPSANDVIGWNTAADALVNYTPNTGAFLAADVDYLAYTAVRGKFFANAVGAAAGATINLGTLNSNRVNISGSGVSISSFGTSVTGQPIYFIKMSGVNTLVNSANLVLPSGANITTATGDTFMVFDEGFSVFSVRAYEKADGTPLAGASGNSIITSTLNTAVTFPSLAAATYSANVSGLDTDITPSTASKRVKVTLTINIGINATAIAGFFRLMRDTTAIGVGTSGHSGSVYIASNIDANTVSLTFIDEPATASQVTYGVQVRHNGGSPVTVHVNRRASDATVMGISTMTVEEID